MENGNSNRSLRIPAALTLAGHLGYVAVTQIHAGGPANDHHTIFHTYAADRIWEAVHLGQFAAMAVMLAGLIALAFTLASRPGAVRWLGRFAIGASAAALALYGALQAVDGVALKQAVTAWASAPEAEKAARFATAETVRWLEWGMRSYQDFALGLALSLVAAATWSIRHLRAIAVLMGASALAYFAQGWIAGTDGFSADQSLAIIIAWVACLMWMVLLLIFGGRVEEREGESRSPTAVALA